MNPQNDSRFILVDQLNRPIRDLRISVMDTCNYRCPYCMPADKFDDDYQFLKPNQRLSFDEIIRVVKVFAEFGVNKIRLTGGEPLLRKNLAELFARIKHVDGIEDVALTTNGQLLKKQLPNLIDAGLDRINISLDTIDDALYYQMSGQKGRLDVVLEAIETARNSRLTSVKINCVIQKGVNEHHILPLLERYQNTNVVVRFIEFMDVGNKNDWQQDKVVSFKDTLNMIQQRWSVEPINPNYKGEVASRYKYTEQQGEIGFITSISKPFCRDCSRARLSADGQLFTCLFSHQSTNLKQLLRTENNSVLKQTIKNVWQNRDDRYSEIRHTIKQPKEKIEMYVIGG